MKDVSGHCLCGAVRFKATEVDPHYHACHCGMCRRWSSGPMFAASAKGVTFEGSEHITRYDSSEWAERGFCGRCGTNLFFYVKPADRYILSVGAFDDPTRFNLVGEIYIDHKPDDYSFAGDITRQTEAEFLREIGALD